MHEYGCVFTGVHLSAHVESGCAFWEYMGIQMCVIISECMCEWRVGRASTISTKVMDLRAVRQYVCCLQLITKSRCLLEKATLYFVFYRITYYALVFCDIHMAVNRQA